MDFLLGKPPESLYKTSALFTFIIILMLLVEDRGGNDLIILKNEDKNLRHGKSSLR